MAVLPSVVRRLGVAVRAEERDVLEAIVLPVAVDVMKRHVERLPEPFVEAASLTSVLLEACREKP